jgi:hypothetical protein
MDRPENDAPQDGAKFLEQLDAALDGKTHACEHADLAAFGAELKNVLNSNEDEMNTTAPEKLSRSLNLKTRKEKSSVVKLDKKLSRFRLGLLDIAALFGVAVLGFLIWNALKTPAPTAKKDPEPVPIKKENTFAAEDGKEKSKEKEADPAPDEDPLERDEIGKKLQRAVTLEFVDIPVEESLSFLRRISNITMIIDPKATAGGLPPLTLKVQDMRFESALNWVARLSGLRVSVRDNAIFFSKPGDELLRVEAYDTKDLKLRAESLATILQRMPFEPSFRPESKAAVVGKDGMLTVTSSMQVHEQVRQILKQAQDGASGMIELEPQPSWKAALEKKLENKVTFDFNDTKLEDATGFLQTLTNVPIILDPEVIAKGAPILTLRVQEMTARNSLEWIVRLGDLNFDIRDEAIYIFKGDMPQHVVAYKPEHFEKHVKRSLSDMANEIRNRINPKSWDAGAGAYVEEMDGWLVVRHSKDVHRDIQNWLTGKVKEAGQLPQ